MGRPARLTEIVGSDYDAVIVFDGDDGCASDYGRLGMCIWSARLEVRVIVVAVDVIARLLTWLVCGNKN